MEYLPSDPNDVESKNKEKTEKKLKEFRQYIVDKGVVLAFVKVLLSLKYAEKKPKNPIKAIREFFGKYKDPRWEEVGALQEKNITLSNENEKMLLEIAQMEEELKNLKRQRRIDQLFNLFELDKNGLISSKLFIEKLSGNKKFDVDEKLDKPGLIQFIEGTVEKDSEEENEMLTKIEEALNGNPVYKDDLENPIYVKIMNYFRNLKKANTEAKGGKK